MDPLLLYCLYVDNQISANAIASFMVRVLANTLLLEQKHTNIPFTLNSFLFSQNYLCLL